MARTRSHGMQHLEAHGTLGLIRAYSSTLGPRTGILRGRLRPSEAEDSPGVGLQAS